MPTLTKHEENKSFTSAGSPPSIIQPQNLQEETANKNVFNVRNILKNRMARKLNLVRQNSEDMSLSSDLESKNSSRLAFNNHKDS